MMDQEPEERLHDYYGLWNDLDGTWQENGGLSDHFEHWVGTFYNDWIVKGSCKIQGQPQLQDQNDFKNGEIGVGSLLKDKFYN